MQDNAKLELKTIQPVATTEDSKVMERSCGCGQYDVQYEVEFCGSMRWRVGISFSDFVARWHQFFRFAVFVVLIKPIWSLNS